MKHVALYIPGLEDQKSSKAQAHILKLWKIYNVDVTYHPMSWSDKQPFADKFESILKDLDRLIASGNKVSIIGVSAGASAAINAYAARQKGIHKVVCICGKLNNSQTIHNSTYLQNPAFKGSMDTLNESLDNLNKHQLNKILSLRPLRDNIVPPNDTIVSGSYNKLLPTIGHGLSITYALTLGSARITRFIKN